MENKLIRVADIDPERCGGNMATGQCPYQRIPGGIYCPMHGGPSTKIAAEKKEKHDFQLKMWQGRVNQFSGSDQVKNLFGEIGILRLTLESIIGEIQNANGFVVFSDKIGQLTGQISKTAYQLQIIQEKNRELLDKTVVFNIADAIINIVATRIDDPDLLAQIGEEIHVNIAGLISGKNPAGADTAVHH